MDFDINLLTTKEQKKFLKLINKSLCEGEALYANITNKLLCRLLSDIEPDLLVRKLVGVNR